MIGFILLGTLLTISFKSKDLDFSGTMPVFVISVIAVLMLSIFGLAFAAYRRK